VIVVEVSQALEQLQHVALYLRFLEPDFWIVEKAREIVVHIRGDHVENGALSPLGPRSLDSHLFQLQDVLVREHFEQLNFSQRCDGESVLFVVHQDFFEGKDVARRKLARLVDFTKSTLSELLHHLVVADFAASLEAALQRARRRRTRRIRHSGDGAGWVP